ncbi:hypothetical protein NE237_031672 [Protea cynaroides]|uniref:Uncharacterized protein n=1 Tax=Protea cynaroides TaxID=273540 RepID=A0A9Q0R2T1_9MAGN|nr:hypothetical protein NE237_031672 [Protea cynaroides]
MDDVSFSFPWKIKRFLTCVILLSLSFQNGFALKTPFYPRISWPMINSRKNAVDLLPTFVGAVSSTNVTLEWKGACFYETQAWMEFNNKSGSEFGGGTLHLKVMKDHSTGVFFLIIFWIYFIPPTLSMHTAGHVWISTSSQLHTVTWDYYFLSREHTLKFKEWVGKAEYEYVKNNGVSIFLMHSGMLETLRALTDVYPLLSNSELGENRPQSWVTNINVDDIHSGDFLAISKIRGRWGAFETLEKWVTG